MKLRNAFLLAFVIALLAFAAFNWSAIGAAVPVNYFLGSGELPLGAILLVMLGIMVIFHLVTESLRDASGAVDKWVTERKLNDALKRAMDTDDDRVSRLAKDVESQHRLLEKKIDALLDQFEEVKLAKLIEKETEEVEDRIGEAEKEIRKDIRKHQRRSRRG